MLTTVLSRYNPFPLQIVKSLPKTSLSISKWTNLAVARDHRDLDVDHGTSRPESKHIPLSRYGRDLVDEQFAGTTSCPKPFNGEWIFHRHQILLLLSPEEDWRR